MRVLIAAAFLIQAIAFTSAHANDGSHHAMFNDDRTAGLEKAFWVCDYAGTNGMIRVAEAAACIAVTDDLKRTKFDGDFDQLVAWWKLNKVAQHQELERISNTEIERRHVGGAI